MNILFATSDSEDVTRTGTYASIDGELAIGA